MAFLLISKIQLLLFVLQLTSVPSLLALSLLNNASDQHALLSFKNSITFDPLNALGDWSPNINFCNWTGIACSLHEQRVVSLDLAGMGLKGSISSFIGNISSLRILNLSNNTLHGPIPLELGQKLTNLEELQVWLNQLRGEIPTSLSNCSKLRWLDLSLNLLSGTVPVELGKLVFLQCLLLQNNQFVSQSTTALPFLTALINCSVLEKVNLDNNHLSYALPLSIDKLSTKLSFLSLANTNIGGNIPPQIGNLTSLTFINLTSNLLSGTLPSSLGRLQNLERLPLGHNKLQGNIPSEIGNLTERLGLISLEHNLLSGQIPETIGKLRQLRFLHLHHNQLSGNIPDCIGKCQLMDGLDLSYNSLNGSIPREVASLQHIWSYLYLSRNSLQGSLPPEIRNMMMVQAIDISDNQLSGVIPYIGSSVLKYLDLSRNRLHGPIPTSFGIGDLEYLDLSINNLSGSIPNYFENLKVLQLLNFSFNNLTGGIPKARIFTKLNSIVIHGKSWPLWTMDITPTHMSSIHSSSTSGFVSRSLILPRISHEELMDATNGFRKGNLLGVGSFGSVYKGVLSDGTLVAVKVLNLQNEEAHKSFSTECQVLGKARHRNLVRIITACSNLDFKGLVLEFITNGSLERHLYSDSGDCNGIDGCVYGLSLIKRYNIALDIASGLAYLHHDCSIQVVHCDLKPSNVLLDYYMTARVTDFGNAALTGENFMDPLKSAVTVNGTIGYIAPEYGVGSNISTKGDVYSYGVVLLEMLTKKKPTSEMFVEELTLPKWVSMAFPDRIVDIVDSSLQTDISIFCVRFAKQSECSRQRC
eukprot:Gb_41584 [translate_table: standard]